MQRKELGRGGRPKQGGRCGWWRFCFWWGPTSHAPTRMGQTYTPLAPILLLLLLLLHPPKQFWVLSYFMLLLHSLSLSLFLSLSYSYTTLSSTQTNNNKKKFKKNQLTWSCNYYDHFLEVSMRWGLSSNKLQITRAYGHLSNQVSPWTLR